MSLKVIFAMNLTKKVSTFVSSLVCLFAFSEASAQTLPNGTFDKTSFGPIEISCVSSSLCFASYEDGKSFMYLTSPDDNNQFVGFWAEPDASQTCSAVHQFPNISTMLGAMSIFTSISLAIAGRGYGAIAKNNLIGNLLARVTSKQTKKTRLSRAILLSLKGL